MKSNDGSRTIGWLLCTLVFALAIFPSLAAGQDSSQQTSDKNPPRQDSSTLPEKSDATPASPVGAGWLDSYFYQIGTAGLLAGSGQGLHWGGLYIPGASATGVIDRFEGTQTTPGQQYSVGVLQTTVIYDHLIGHNDRIAVQYQPSLAFANGQVYRDFSNQYSSLDLLLFTRPRWNVRFNDGFLYRYAQRSVGYPYFDANPVTSGTVQNGFLDGPTRWLSDTANLTVGYALSPRSTLGITPAYTFSESGSGSGFARAASYGGIVNWIYRMSGRQTVGLVYNSQLIRETSGSTFDTFYQTVAATAGRQLSGTWSIQGSAGITTSTDTIPKSTRGWYFYGSFGTIKQLNHASSLALNYSRGDTLATGLISSQYADRLDVSLQRRISARLNWSIGAGYLHEVQSQASGAWYAGTHAQFLLAPRAGLLATFDYTHKGQQLGNVATDLFNGDRDLFTFGIMWQPAQKRQ
jgi:hypothetical protein